MSRLSPNPSWKHIHNSTCRCCYFPHRTNNLLSKTHQFSRAFELGKIANQILLILFYLTFYDFYGFVYSNGWELCLSFRYEQLLSSIFLAYKSSPKLLLNAFQLPTHCRYSLGNIRRKWYRHKCWKIVFDYELTFYGFS